MSFTLYQYRELFQFALDVFHRTRIPELRGNAIKIMLNCERVIGQQHLPPQTRLAIKIFLKRQQGT